MNRDSGYFLGHPVYFYARVSLKKRKT